MAETHGVERALLEMAVEVAGEIRVQLEALLDGAPKAQRKRIPTRGVMPLRWAIDHPMETPVRKLLMNEINYKYF